MRRSFGPPFTVKTVERCSLGMDMLAEVFKGGSSVRYQFHRTDQEFAILLGGKVYKSDEGVVQFRLNLFDTICEFLISRFRRPREQHARVETISVAAETTVDL